MRRDLLSCLMSLLLVVTSHSMAAARNADPAVDRMVICAGNTTTRIFVDAGGEQTLAPHLCPDCVLHVLAHCPAAHWILLRVRATDLNVATPAPRFRARAAFARAWARAPPSLI